MTKVIAIANQKGGVGKTSTTVNLSAGLVRAGYSVLAIDFDPQANLTMALGFRNPDDMGYTVSSVLAKAMNEEPINPVEGILTSSEGIDLMPSSIQLSRFELALVNEMNRESMLRQFVEAVKPNYDYILIDCAPSLNVLALNALTAANSVLIPTQPEFFSNAGLQMLLETVSKARKKINPSLYIEGVLVTMMDKRPNFTKELVMKLRESYGDYIKVFDTEIPKSIRMTESNVSGKSVFGYDPRNPVGLAYKRAWESYMLHLNECAGGITGNSRKTKTVWVIEKFTAHQLRHTYATMLFDANVDIKSAQMFLGHSDIEVTLNIYTHLSKFKTDEAIESLNGHLDKLSEKKYEC